MKAQVLLLQNEVEPREEYVVIDTTFRATSDLEYEYGCTVKDAFQIDHDALSLWPTNRALAVTF